MKLAHKILLAIYADKPAVLCRDVDPKRVYYMSMEFLMGRSLTNALNNIGVVDEVIPTPSSLSIEPS